MALGCSASNFATSNNLSMLSRSGVNATGPNLERKSWNEFDLSSGIGAGADEFASPDPRDGACKADIAGPTLEPPGRGDPPTEGFLDGGAESRFSASSKSPNSLMSSVLVLRILAAPRLVLRCLPPGAIGTESPLSFGLTIPSYM